jgi:hypothetical protein
MKYRECFLSRESWRTRRTWQSEKVTRETGNKGTPSTPVGYLPTLPVAEENTKVLVGTIISRRQSTFRPFGFSLFHKTDLVYK